MANLQQRQNRQNNNPNLSGNRGYFVGTLAKDPVEKPPTKSGANQLVLNVIRNEKFGDKEKTVSLSFIATGKAADNFPGGARKGSLVQITYALSTTYTPPSDEEKAQGGKGKTSTFFNVIGAKVLAQSKKGEVQDTQEWPEDPEVVHIEPEIDQ